MSGRVRRRAGFAAQAVAIAATVVDGAFEILSPTRAADRQFARQGLHELRGSGGARSAFFTLGSAGGGGAYEGAKVGRSQTDWIADQGSADAHILPDLSIMRQRCRWLYNNDGTATAILESLITNIIGTGMTPEPTLPWNQLDIEPKEAMRIGEQMLNAWQRWAPYADAAGRCDMGGLQELLFGSWARDGDVGARIVRSRIPGSPYSIAVETIEADRIDTPVGLKDTRNIRAGVQLTSREGIPIAYWVAKQHPGDALLPQSLPAIRGRRLFLKVPRWDADGRPQFFHLFTVRRGGQSRGIPWLAPVIREFKNFGDYKKAELIAAKVAACFTMVVKTAGRVAGGVKRFVLGKLGDPSADGKRKEKLSPGGIVYLRNDEDVEALNPTRPNRAFDSFTMTMVRSIAAAVGLPYEIAMRDYSKSTWSSARASVVDARRMFVQFQQKFANCFLVQLWKLVMEEAWLRGDITGIKNFRRDIDLWCQVRFNGQGFEWVDPQKEGAGHQIALANKTGTRDEFCRKRLGKPFRQVAEQLALENEIIKELGLSSSPPPSPAGQTPPPPEPPPPAEPEEDEEDDSEDEPEESTDPAEQEKRDDKERGQHRRELGMTG